MAPLIVLIVASGVFPKPVLDRITPSVNQLVIHVDRVTNTQMPAGLDPARRSAVRPGIRRWPGRVRQSTTVAAPSPIQGGAP